MELLSLRVFNMHKIFYELDDDEKIILMVRQHFVTLLIKLFFWLIILSIPFILRYIIFNVLGFVSNDLNIISIILIDIYLLFAFCFLLTFISLYYLNIHIVTNKRILDIDQLSATNHKTAETKLENIQDVSAKVKGIWGNIFNFGTVDIQSAGAEIRISFENIGNPKLVKRIILDQFYQRTRKVHPANGR